VASTQLTFSNRGEHRAWLAQQAPLPRGFRVGSHSFGFTPVEADMPAKMTITLISADRPTADFAAVFTRNAFPGAPVIIGRQRLDEPKWGAILVNNKISNVCAPGGVETAESLCSATAATLGLKPNEVLPSSTGVIGWTLPSEAMQAAIPHVAATLQASSILPAAEGIVTTDLYPKVRSVEIGGGRIVGIAKGAGMIEPNMATMLVYVLTDLKIDRQELRASLQFAVDQTFNRISVDSDTSTSDTVAVLSSGRVEGVAPADFRAALVEVCRDLAEDVVRNGEGIRHVLEIRVRGTPSDKIAVGIGKIVANAPLFKCAIAGNDPNVGRLVQAIGKYLGQTENTFDTTSMTLKLGGHEIFRDGVFQLNPAKEAALVAHLEQAELYRSKPDENGNYTPPVDYPPHERTVLIEITFDTGPGRATVIGGDLTHEYVTENADYRS
jgi:glutamate N-acetyltransferase/amino-acid N-acetyltransferase